MPVVVALVIVSLLGGAGYMVMKRNNASSNQATATSKADKQKTEQSKDSAEQSALEKNEFADWKIQEAENLNLAYKYPGTSSWSSGVEVADTGSREYKNGKRGYGSTGFNECGKNCGLAFTYEVYQSGSTADVGIDYIQNIRMRDNSLYALKSKENIKIGGAEGIRFEYVPAENYVSPIIYYYMTHKGYSYLFEINLNGAKTDKIDITGMGEKIFSTVRFL